MMSAPVLGLEEHHTGRDRSIVFLRGAGVTGWLWDAQVAALTDYHCVVVDLPGHASSREIRWESLDATADLVAEVIRERAHGGTAIVVGLSLGADVGLRLLARHPELVQTAILTGMVAKPLGGVTRWLQQVAAPMAGWKSLRGATASSMGLTGERRAAFLREGSGLGTADYRVLVDEILSGVPLDGLELVTVPTLILAGGKEPKVARESTAIIEARMPGAHARIVPGVGHTWNVEAPELFTGTVRGWIERGPADNAE